MSDPQTQPARTRRILAYGAAGYAFAGGLALTAVGLFVGAERVEVALPIFLASLPTATAVIGWVKGTSGS